MKKRLDILLVEQGLADSREKAKAIIMSGIVYVDNEKEDKAGSTFEETCRIEVRGKTLPYVSRGGLKLEKAMKSFPITLQDRVCMDVGASTGGFTDCMLQNGARQVFAVDVGHGQLDWKLRNDPRVVCMEKTNIRYVTRENIGGAQLDFASIDVSFISLTKVLPPVYEMLRDEGEVVALIKPQFEAGREKVGKKGVVRDRKVHREVIEVRKEISSIWSGCRKEVHHLPKMNRRADRRSLRKQWLRRAMQSWINRLMSDPKYRCNVFRSTGRDEVHGSLRDRL